jgi:hypothetical protein
MAAILGVQGILEVAITRAGFGVNASEGTHGAADDNSRLRSCRVQSVGIVYYAIRTICKCSLHPSANLNTTRILVYSVHVHVYVWR